MTWVRLDDSRLSRRRTRKEFEERESGAEIALGLWNYNDDLPFSRIERYYRDNLDDVMRSDAEGAIVVRLS